MSFAFQYLAVATSALPTITLPGSSDTFITFWNGDSVNSFTITATDDNGAYVSIPVSPGANSLVKHVRAYQVSVSGTASPISLVVSSSEVSAETLAQLSIAAVSISGTVKTDVGQGSQVAGGTTLQYGGTLIDPRNIRDLTASDVQGAIFTGGGVAPISGTWTFTVVGNGGTPTLNTHDLASATLASGQLATYTVAVVSGTTYTVLGVGSVFSGWISVT